MHQEDTITLYSSWKEQHWT